MARKYLAFPILHIYGKAFMYIFNYNQYFTMCIITAIKRFRNNFLIHVIIFIFSISRA